MKKLILCVLLAASNAAAEYTSVVFQELDACVHVTFSVDSSAGTTALFIDEDSDTSNGVRTRNYGNGTNRGNLQLCGLKEGTKYYASVSTVNHGLLACTEVCTDCDFGPGQSLGFNCDAIGEPPNFTTPSSFGANPTPPFLPVHSFDPAEICEAAPATSRTVTCEDGVATDWDAKWNDARDQDSDQVHEILIPSGCVVQQDARVTFGDWKGPGLQTGGVVVRTAGDPRLFPPTGVRTDPTYVPLLGGFRAPANRTMFGEFPAFIPFFFANNSSDVCFQNLRFDLPEAEDTNRVVRIVDVSGTNNNILTTAEPLGSDVHDSDDVILDFDDCQGLQGAKNAFDADKNTSRIGISGGPYQPTGECRSGRAIFFSGAKIASVEPTDPVQVHFTSEHAFYDLEDLSVDSITDNLDGTSTLVLGSPMHITRGQQRYIIGQDVVRLTGSGTDLDERMLVVSSSSLTTIVVPGSASCSGGCGTVREHHTVVISGARLPEINGAHHYRKVDLDTIELLDATVPRAAGPGGYALNDSDARPAMINARNWQSRIALDRVYVDCGLFPYRAANCVSISRGSRFSVANSFFIGPKRSFAIDPVSGQIRDSVESSSNSGPLFLTYNGSSDVQLRNTSVGDTHGIVFAGDNRCGDPMSDITAQRVLTDKPNRLIAGHPESNGLYHNDRHSFEVKCGERILLEGYQAAGSWADGTPSAAAVMIRALGGGGLFDSHPTRDVTIRGLHIPRSASGIQFLQGPVDVRAAPIQRISLTHSLFEELDYDQYASQPGQITGQSKANCCNFAGSWLFFSGDQSDILISNNTLGDQRCRGIGCLLDIGGGFQSRLVLEKNVMPFSRNGFAFGVDHEDNGKNAYNPSCDGLPSGQAIWECQVHQVQADGQHIPDPFSAFRDNVVFGGLENMFVSKSAFDELALSDDDSITVTPTEAEDYFSGWTTGNIYSSGDSMAERLAATFKPGSWESIVAGRGYDRRQFMAYRGLIDAVALTDLGGGVARLSYEGAEAGDLTPEQCWVDYSLDPAFGHDWWLSGDRIADGGASGPRAVDLVGLDPGKLYHWRLSCPGTQTRGQFRTEALSPQ